MLPCSLPYETLLLRAAERGVDAGSYLRDELPYLWLDTYLKTTQRPTNVMIFTHGTFDYLYDDYATLEATGAVEADGIAEARLVAAIGVASTNTKSRDDSRLRGWVGPTGATFGSEWDKGHFIAHSIGGAVDGLEANVFLQRRSVNRGAYREMEKYCAAHPGVLCFSRPIYSDPSAVPSSVEFGVLKADGALWIQRFDNQ